MFEGILSSLFCIVVVFMGHTGEEKASHWSIFIKDCRAFLLYKFILFIQRYVWVGVFPFLKDLYLFWTLHMQDIPIFEILFKIVLYILPNHLSHLHSVGLPAEPDIYFLA